MIESEEQQLVAAGVKEALLYLRDHLSDEDDHGYDLLNDRYGKGFAVHKDSNKWRICANSKIAYIVLDDLKDGFPQGMERKLP